MTLLKLKDSPTNYKYERSLRSPIKNKALWIDKFYRKPGVPGVIKQSWFVGHVKRNAFYLISNRMKLKEYDMIMMSTAICSGGSDTIRGLKGLHQIYLKQKERDSIAIKFRYSNDQKGHLKKTHGIAYLKSNNKYKPLIK